MMLAERHLLKLKEGEKKDGKINVDSMELLTSQIEKDRMFSSFDGRFTEEMSSSSQDSLSQPKKMEIIEPAPEVIEIDPSAEIKYSTDGRYIEVKGFQIPKDMLDHKHKMKYEDRHDVPCPSKFGDVSSHDIINEWVGNHLPLKEEEKKKMFDELYKENLIKEREEASRKLKEAELQLAKNRRPKNKRHSRFSTHNSTDRKSVKDK